MEHQNYDRLKVLIGHELVHVGQFREHPMLLAEYRAGFLALLEQQQQRDLVPGLLRDLSAAVLSGAAAPLQAETIQQQLTQRQAALADIEQPFQMLNKNIEGYAFHVEVDFVRAVYNCAWPMPHHSAADHLLSSVVGGLQSALSRLQGGRSSTDGSDTSTEQTLQDFLIEQMGADLPQYIEGRAFYQQHQQHPQRPARFYPYAHHPPAGEAGHSG